MSEASDSLKQKRVLSDALHATLVQNLFTNRYMLHPSRVAEFVAEAVDNAFAFFESGDIAPVMAFGDAVAREGLSVESLMAAIAALHRSGVGGDRISGFSTNLVIGFVSAREAQLLSDQEQLRRALTSALESQSRELLVKNQAIDSSINGILIADIDGKVSYINRSFLSAWGYDSPEEVLGRKIDEFWADEEARAVVRNLVRTGGWRGELPAKRKDGSLITVSLSASYIRNARGSSIGILASFIDVTESRHLELQMQQIQKMDDLGQLAGGIVHDFNNLLAAIGGYLQLLLLDAPADGQVHQDLLQIKSAVDRGAGLTKQLGYFTRQATGKRQVINLNDVASETYELLRHTFPRNIAFQLQLSSSLWTIEADPNQMSQVIMNLCVNSREAIIEKGEASEVAVAGTLCIETVNVELSEYAARQYVDVRPGRYVRLRVSDTGVGIAPEVQKRLFVPFVTTKKPSRGTGLGLAVVYGIVRSHLGFIDVTSAKGLGTTFLVYLPMAGRPDEVRAPIEPDSELVRGNGTLLVVDDEVQVREVVARALTRAGYRVLEASGGRDAINAYREHQSEISLVVLDMIMPEMDGHETLVRLRQLNPDVSALFLTGYTNDTRLRELAEKGLAQVLEKPVDLRALSERVQELLRLDRESGLKHTPPIDTPS